MNDTNCRLCFKKLNDNYSCVFYHHNNNELSLGEKIMICLSIPVHSGDNLSKKICINCSEEVTRFYDFRNKCHSTYYSLIQTCNTKKESVDNKINFNLTKEEEISEEYVKNPSLDADNIVSELDNTEIYLNVVNYTNNNSSPEKVNSVIKIESKNIDTSEDKQISKKYKCFYCETLFNSYQETVDHCIKCLANIQTNGINNCKNNEQLSSDYAEIEFIEDDMDCDDNDKTEELVDYQEINNSIENIDNNNKEDNNLKDEEDYISSDEPYQNETENTDPKEFLLNNIPQSPSNSDVSLKRKYCKKKIYPNNYPCSECNKSFTSRSLMRRHLMVHTGERPHKCETCGRRFSQLGALNFHKKLHKDPPYRCNICQKPFMRPSDLEKHLRTHTGEKPYTCHVCGKNFTQLVAVQQHERIHTGDKPFQCKICGKTFSQSANKSKHEKIHQKGAKPFVCDTCGRSFSDDEEMQFHKAGHGGEITRECDFCGIKFKKLSEVVDHVRRFHTFEKPHTCDICKKAFYSLYSLKQHIMTHTGQKPYGCTECSSKFTQKGNLVKHFARKHTDKIFKDLWNGNDNYNDNNHVQQLNDNLVDKSDDGPPVNIKEELFK